jgi:hypothetical protein
MIAHILKNNFKVFIINNLTLVLKIKQPCFFGRKETRQKTAAPATSQFFLHVRQNGTINLHKRVYLPYQVKNKCYK